MNMGAINKIERLLSENHIGYTDVKEISNGLPVSVIEVEIDGDQRHDHMMARNILCENGFYYLGMFSEEEGDGDYYKASYRFTDNKTTYEFSKLFN